MEHDTDGRCDNYVAAYSSSKAALTNISECMRHELAPFGVSVVTIMTGLVTSNFHNNNTATQLPQNSRYAVVGKTIEEWTSGRAIPDGMPADQFAAHIASDIVGQGQGGLVWRGYNAGTVKFATGWFPSFVLVSPARSL